MLKCIDLFAGCGGLSLGLEMAGFETLLFSEINKDAAATFKANRRSDIVEIGDVYSFSDYEISSLTKKWKSLGIEDIDLVAGGPPCQGYSGIGHRRTFQLEKQDIPSNQLFHQMIRVINGFRPRMFLFENVGGLRTSKWTREGQTGEIFRDVLSEFLKVPGYSVRWQFVHSKDYGVPQNRPRILIVGIRNDQRFSLRTPLKSDETILAQTAIAEGLLPKPDHDYPNIEELLSDLCDPNYRGKYSTDSYLTAPLTRFQKQLRTKKNGELLKKGDSLTDQEYSSHAPRIVEKFSHMIANNGEIPEGMRTKKFAQRVLPRQWGAGGPSITATSLPDDYVHYSQPRILTVREWARLQMFPDWYVFKGARTTGGRRRAGDPSIGQWERDVPKYTQIGNAVPVELARKIGLHLAGILRK
jgi:DNA (cytosine-5)-methyltransferase 1